MAPALTSSESLAERPSRGHRAWQVGLLAALAVALYLAPTVGTDDDRALIALSLFLGAPVLAGVLVRSRAALAIPVSVGLLLALTYVLQLGGDNEFWSDAFALPTIVVMTAIEIGGVAAGAALGRRLAT